MVQGKAQHSRWHSIQHTVQCVARHTAQRTVRYTAHNVAQHGTWPNTAQGTAPGTAQHAPQGLRVPPRYLLGGHIPLPCHHLTQLCSRAQQWHRQPHAQRAPAFTLQHQCHIQRPGDTAAGI